MESEGVCPTCREGPETCECPCPGCGSVEGYCTCPAPLSEDLSLNAHLVVVDAVAVLWFELDKLSAQARDALRIPGAQVLIVVGSNAIYVGPDTDLADALFMLCELSTTQALAVAEKLNAEIGWTP